MPSPIKSESLGLEPSPPHLLKLIQRFQFIKEEGKRIRESEERKKEKEEEGEMDGRKEGSLYLPTFN